MSDEFWISTRESLPPPKMTVLFEVEGVPYLGSYLPHTGAWFDSAGHGLIDGATVRYWALISPVPDRQEEGE